MKVVHLSTTDTGGAYEAAQRISDCLVKQGIDSKVLVRTKYRNVTTPIPFYNNFFSRFWSKSKNFLNLMISDGEVVFDKYGADICRHPLIKETDIICLHWVNSFISNKEVARILALGKPVFWVMHDMWPFTGGCHYSHDCTKYETKCEECERMQKKNNKKTLYWQNRKEEYFNRQNLYPIGPSRWICNCAQKSIIFGKRKIVLIPNPIDTNLFYPKDGKEIGQIQVKYRLSKRKKTLLFAAMRVTNNPIKGFSHFVNAVKKLPKEEYQVLLLGESVGEQSLKEQLGMQIVSTGFIDNAEILCDIYNVADLLVAPSLQENYSNTVLESLACATPVVAFNVGGMSDLIESGYNGYLAHLRDAEDLYHGILQVEKNRKEYGINARERVLRNNSFSVIANKYINCFMEHESVMVSGKINSNDTAN